ncbi:hypothetical protein [Ectopseudomonas guguanensis]|uniref:hypothetical protein n=1 Tax=Ectopseudomonas guguanensis TaxID=1198456 RepID=UPI0028A5EF4D|nr:hypothetical protein [Pseudomonas guguanensis]
MAAAPDVLVLGQPFVLVLEPVAPPAIVVAAGTQGPPGRNGVDGATISPDPDNQIQNRPNGLYVPPTEWGGTEW